MQAYMEKIKKLLAELKEWTLSQIPCTESEEVDALAKLTVTSPVHIMWCIPVEFLSQSSISEIEMLSISAPSKPTKMDNIIAYLLHGNLLKDKVAT